MASEIKVDTISEKTSANGVTIDSVSLKDGKVATANSIDSDAYVDGSIDNAHIADDAIDSEHYAAGSIDTAHIADDQITLAKMASGTDGQIITYDASGNPTAVGPGTDGQVLTSTGAGSPPAFEAAASGSTTPYWCAELSATQNTTDATYTKVTFNTEIVDSDTAYDNSTNYRFTVPSGEGGKYFVWTTLVSSASGSYYDEWKSLLAIYKNGSLVTSDFSSIANTQGGTKVAFTNHTLNTIIDLSVGDYLEVFVLIDKEAGGNTPKAIGGSGETQFGGFKLID